MTSTLEILLAAAGHCPIGGCVTCCHFFFVSNLENETVLGI